MPGRADRLVTHVINRLSRWLAIIRLVPRAGRSVVAAAIVLNVVLGVLPLGFVVGTSVMLDLVATSDAAGAGPGGVSAVSAAFGVALAALLLQHILMPLNAVLGELITRRVDGYCARRLVTATLSDAPMELMERRDVLDQLSDVRVGLVERDLTPGSAVAGLIALVSRYAQVGGAVILVAWALGPSAGIVVAGCACVARFGNRGSLSRWSAVISDVSTLRRKLRYVADAGSDTAGAKEIRVLGILPWWRDRARTEAAAYFRPLWSERRRIYYAPFLIFSGVVLLGAVVVMFQLRAATARHGLSVLELSIAIQAILIPMRFGVFFPESDVQTQYGMHAHETLVDLEQRFTAGARAVSAGTGPTDGLPEVGIRFERVSFAYPGSDRSVLDDLDLELRAGQSTAIIGLNGAGKTTLVKLMTGLYQPGAGRILVDGINLRELDSRAWQRRLAVVFQDFGRYELSAAANIGLGAPEWAQDEAALRSAAEWAGVTDLLGDLPAGPATPLSARYTGGVDLSGGQWQRIALARALFAVGAGASVLVLDEPTAHLDVRAEAAFFDRFLTLTHGLTAVVISHRFATVRRADRVVVLADGRVVEDGDHDQLISRDGRYAELFHLQARRFTEAASAVEEGSV